MPIQIDAKLNAFRRSPKGFFITLEVSPDSDWEDLARAPLGQAFGVAMVAYDAETGETSPGADSPPRDPDAGQQRDQSGKSRQPFHKLSRAQQAGILCNDAKFSLWMSTAHPLPDVKDVADAVRQVCGVKSRSLLDTEPHAGRFWDRLVSEFHQATGRMAEAR